MQQPVIRSKQQLPQGEPHCVPARASAVSTGPHVVFPPACLLHTMDSHFVDEDTEQRSAGLEVVGLGLNLLSCLLLAHLLPPASQLPVTPGALPWPLCSYATGTLHGNCHRLIPRDRALPERHHGCPAQGSAWPLGE